MQKSPEILLIAGEASGDVLGAELIHKLHELSPATKLTIMGGPKMAATEAELLVDSRHFGMMGVLSILTHFFVIRKAYLRIKHHLEQNRPKLVILIDYPGLNLRIAKIAHGLGIKVLYYVSPKIWASRYHRIHTIRKYVDRMVVFFKFEEELFQRENVPVTLVTHPLTKISKLHLDRTQICANEGLDPNKIIIALLPGSRSKEISRLMPLLCASKRLIQQKYPEAQFVIPLASSIAMSELQKYLHRDPEIKVLQRPAYETLAISKAAIVASGTATLEAALSNIPFVIVYKSWEYRLVKKLIKTPYIGLCNIAAQKMVVRELIEYDAKADIVAAETLKLIDDESYRQTILAGFKRMQDQLGKADAAETVAKLAMEYF